MEEALPDGLTRAPAFIERMFENARSNMDNLPQKQREALEAINRELRNHGVDYKNMAELWLPPGVEWSQYKLNKPLSQWKISHDEFLRVTRGNLVFLHDGSSSTPEAMIHQYHQDGDWWPNEYGVESDQYLWAMKHLASAAGFVVQLYVDAYLVEDAEGYEDLLDNDAHDHDFDIFFTEVGFKKFAADALTLVLRQISPNREVYLGFRQRGRWHPDGRWHPRHDPNRLPLSYSHLCSLFLDEFVCDNVQISESQQRALVRSCRKLVLRHCMLDESGKGLVDAIVQEPERQLAIKHTVKSLPVTELPKDLSRSFIPQQRLMKLTLEYEPDFPFLDDYQVHRLFLFLHTQALYDPTNAIKLYLPWRSAEILLSGQHPLSVEWLGDQLSAFMRGETSMRWLKFAILDDRAAFDHFVAPVLRKAVAHANQDVAAILARIQQDACPFSDGRRSVEWVRNRAVDVLTDAAAAVPAAL